MDVNLPGIDGIEAARRIRAQESPPVVILLSTYDEDEFDISGCGASAYVAKSTFSPDRLEQLWSAATTGGQAGAATGSRTRNDDSAS